MSRRKTRRRRMLRCRQFRAVACPTSARFRQVGSNRGRGRARSRSSFPRTRNVFVLTRTSLDGMPRSFVHTRDKRVGELPSVAEEPPFKPKRRSKWSSRAGDFYTTIVRPHDFDPKKKYPVIAGRLRRAAPLARRPGDAELARAAVARGPGLHRRRDRQPRHAGPRPRLGAGDLPEVRHRAARRSGEGAASLGGEVSRNWTWTASASSAGRSAATWRRTRC